MSVNNRGSVDTILLAGGTKKDALTAAMGAPSKALVPLSNGQTMLQAVLSVLRQCPSIHRIVVIGDPVLEAAVRRLGAEFVQQQGALVDNLVQGFAALACPERCLVATCDIPLISSEAVEALIHEGRRLAADILYPIVTRDLIEQQYPGGKRTYATLREGTFTGGNLLWLSGEFVQREQRVIQSVFEARKSPLKLCRLIGWRFVLRFLTKRLTLREIEDRIGRLLHCTARAVILPYPEIAFDVDKPEDLTTVEKFLGKGNGGRGSED